MEIVGQWVLEKGRLIPDETEEMISSLLKNYLLLVHTTNDGWTRIYHDSRDGKFWELTYVDASTQGGGPRKLRSISAAMAQNDYVTHP